MARHKDILAVWFLFFLWMSSGLLACQSGKTSEKDSNKKRPPTSTPGKKVNKRKVQIILTSPKSHQTFQIGEIIPLKYNKPTGSTFIDSCQYSIDNSPAATYPNEGNDIQIKTDTLKPGNHKISFLAFINGEPTSRSSVEITLWSDILPKQYGFKIVNTYSHDRNAYTQGLVFDDGFFYEGTGIKGKSSLRKIKFQTGEVVASLNLPPDLFGEGITIFGNRIIQLTWTSGLGFVYDKNSFRFLNKIHYNTQGWGLTTNGVSLIMSDGTNHIYFIEPTYFTEISHIEVYDDKGAVNNLNELEYIDGLIYANIYQTDRIAIIDPPSGKVQAYINLNGLLKKDDRKPDTDVLNGIAWDDDAKRLFVTGKNWPKLFEIELIPR